MSSVLSTRPSHGILGAPMLRRALRAGTVAITLIVVLLMTLFANVPPASAYWTSTGSTKANAATGTLLPPTNVTASGTKDVAVSWTGSAGSPTPAGYFVTRTSGGMTTAACGSSPDSLLTLTSCTDVGAPDGTYTYSVTAAFRSWTAMSASSGSVTVTTKVATRLVFLTAPVSGPASDRADLGPLTVQLQDDSGFPMDAPAGGTVLTLASDSTGRKTFSLTRGGAGVTSMTIPGGSSSATFYYGDEKAGTPTITARAGLLTATQMATVTALAGTHLGFKVPEGSSPATLPTRATIGPIIVQFQDRFGNAVVTTESIVVSLATNSKTGSALFAASREGASITTVTILANTSGTDIYFGDSKAGAPEISATGAGMVAIDKVSLSSPNSQGSGAATSSTSLTAASTTSTPAPAPVTTSAPAPAPSPEPTPAPKPTPAVTATPALALATEPAQVLAPADPPVPTVAPQSESIESTEPLVATKPSYESTGS
ncbi:hypothetical protein [Mycetocola sp.]|uniref:hypothetical protein n=1 Tax=Mycetocola sp. TaxID=1871042 RepID=UPI0039899E27